MATAEKRAKAHRLLRNNDAMIDPANYRESFTRALNYLSANYDAKQYRSWITQHYPKVKFGDHSDLEFRTLAALCRLVDNGNELSPQHMAMMDSEFIRLKQPNSKIKAEEDTKKVELSVIKKPSIQEAMDERVSEFMAEFNGLVDQYTTDRTLPKVANLVTTMGIKGPMLKKVAEKVTNVMAELEETLEGSDKQLVEGYSNFKKAELKKLLGIYQDLMTALSQAKVTVVRKARTPKVKPPGVVAKSVKYKKQDDELGLTGTTPVQAVDSSEVWIFNTKYRKLAVYTARDGHTLTFKGTTLQNFDVEKSYCKTVRKPEQLIALSGKRAYNGYMKTIKGKPGKVTGRLNEECLILAVFK